MTAAATDSGLQPRQALLLAIAAGVALRLALIAVAGPPEQFEYDHLARSLVSGRGYIYNQLGTPYRSFYAGLGYIGINAAVDWAFPSQPKAMAVAQSLYAGLLTLVVFQIARRFFGDWLAVASAALVLLHPSLIYYDARKLHPLGFDALTMTTAVWLLMRAADSRRMADAAMAGIAMGFALFQRGSMGAFLACALVWIVLAIEPRTRALGVAAVYLAAAVVVVAPWAARNYTIHGMLLLESMTPQQFWKGNATYSNGSGYLAAGRNVYDVAPEALVRAWRSSDETGHIRLFSDEGIAEVRKDPVRAVALDLKKFTYFWTVPPNSGQQYPAAYFGVYLAYYAAIVIAAAAGLMVAWRQPALRPAVVLVLLFFLSVSAVHALMFVEMRHRWATEPLMLAFAPAGARAIWTRWRR